jgi:hypothetical protein
MRGDDVALHDYRDLALADQASEILALREENGILECRVEDAVAAFFDAADFIAQWQHREAELYQALAFERRSRIAGEVQLASLRRRLSSNSLKASGAA